MNEKMQLLFAHIACVALIVACFWLSTTVLKDQPQLGQIVIGAGLFLWGKIGFKPSAPVIDLILETLTPKQLRKVQSIHPPPPSADPQPVAAVVPLQVQGRACEGCTTLLSPFNTGSLCEACLLNPPPRSAA